MTGKRLSSTDAKALLDCLYNKTAPPSHLSFSIVPAVPGDKLSPPPIAFPVGIYVLLPPLKKPTVRCQAPVVVATAPDHLKECVLPKDSIPTDSCKWRLSGPQNTKGATTTTVQQRYCYPTKMQSEYNDMTGSSLWTKWTDGKDETQYRVLCVYHSFKRRANNKGGIVGPNKKKSAAILKVSCRTRKKSSVKFAPPRRQPLPTTNSKQQQQQQQQPPAACASSIIHFEANTTTPVLGAYPYLLDFVQSAEVVRIESPEEIELPVHAMLAATPYEQSSEYQLAGFETDEPPSSSASLIPDWYHDRYL